ncbi:MAG TPA: TolC family protein [Candidatus Obscuribacterales bacterium]
MPEAASDGRSRLTITLPALLNLVVQGNRDLRDRQLQRLLEQQILAEAEARFDPRLTPTVGVGVRQTFEAGFGGGASLPDSLGGSDTTLGDRLTLTQSAGVLGTVTTRQGTQIGLTLDVLGDTPIRLEFAQPLLRGAGTAINEAPVAIARLQASQNFYDLQQTLIDTVSTTINQYTDLIQTQEAVAIQTQALERRQQQLVILTALVEAGRRAEFDLVDSRRSVANAERDLILAQTRLEQANTTLLDQVGTDENILLVAAADTVADLFQAAVDRIAAYEVETLLAIAYQRRPDYLQTLLSQDIATLNRDLAADDLRWQLDVAGGANLGDLADATVGVVARRTFTDPALETARVESEVTQRQAANRLAQQQTTIRNDITTQLNTVRANLVRVEAARRATDNARLQLEVTQELFQRGRAGGTLFQLITQEENLVEAQNQQLQAEIEFLNSTAALDRAVGLTLATWSRDIDFLPALLTPPAEEPPPAATQGAD